MRNNENINTEIWDSKRSKEMKTIVTSIVTNQKVATDLVRQSTCSLKWWGRKDI